jgi:choline dehydrogenase-like flavoprotein
MPYLSVLGVAMSPQSRGEIRLSSSDPSDPPHIDPKLLDHPFDRQVIIKGMKEMMALHRTKAIERFWEENMLAPANLSDATIWVYSSLNDSSLHYLIRHRNTFKQMRSLLSMQLELWKWGVPMTGWHA